MLDTEGAQRWRFRDTLKNTAVEEWIDRRFHRPLAFLIILPLQKRPRLITPTQITVVAMIAGVLAGIAFAMVPGHGASWYWAGGALVLLSVLLDCADGMLARLTRQTSRLGQILDGYSDFVAGLAVWLGMSLAISRGIDPLIAWPINILSLGTILLHVGVYEKFRENYVRLAEGRRPDPEPAIPKRMQWLWRAAIAFFEDGYSNFFRLVGGISPQLERLSPEQFRANFARPMQFICWVGLGTHLAQIYLLAFLAPFIAGQIFVVLHVTIIGLTNVILLVAIRVWRRQERFVVAGLSGR